MFLSGPFMQVSFLDRGSVGSTFQISSGSTVQLIGSSVWDRMLADVEAPVAYFVEIEPWVLADRS